MIERQVLEQRLAALRELRAKQAEVVKQAEANFNAMQGAIQLLEELLAEKEK